LAKSAFIIIDSKEGLKLGAERGCKREEEVEDEDDDEADGVDVVIEVLGIRGMGFLNRESIPPSSTVDGDLNKSECKSAYQSFCDMVIL
jgi:hypothetical protein